MAAKRPKRPKDPGQLAKLVVDMATGKIPNDKEEILNPDHPRELPSRQKGGGAAPVRPRGK